MILADKIIDLRKKNGWSQEDLAEMLGVSRQAISKWEGAQSMPDMNRILKMSEVFGVSTDFLLKDDMEMVEYISEAPAESDLRTISMEEASEFLAIKEKTAGRTALGVMMCILCPICLIVLSSAQELGRIALSETAAAGIGLVVLFLLIGGAVALFVTADNMESKYDFLEKEPIETAYGVRGMAEERKNQFHAVYSKNMTIGVVLCVLAAIPLFLSMAVFGDNDFASAIAVAFLLALIALGVFLIVRVSIRQGSYQMLLEEGDYTRAEKRSRKKTGWIAGAYWLAIVAGFLLYCFKTDSWNRGWIIWPVAAIVFAILMMAVKALTGNGDQ